MKIYFNLLVVVTLAFCNAVSANQWLSPYPNSEVEKSVKLSGEQTQLMSQFDDSKKSSERFSYTDFIGDVNHTLYEINNVATLKVFENYKHALLTDGFNIVYSCQLDACGDSSDFAEEVGYFQLYNYHRKPYYLLATKGEKPEFAVSLFVGQYNSKTRVMSSSIAIKELETGLIKANTAAFAKQQSNPVTKAPKDDIRGSSDHPLLSRYPGSFIEDYEQIDYEEFSLPTGIFNGKNKALPVEDVTGDITRITYEIRKVSTLKVFHNYVSALTKEGFETVFSCERQACGDDRKAIQALGDHLSVKQVYNYYRQPRYQLMQNTIENQTTFVAFFVGNYQGTTRMQLVIIRTEPLQGDLVKTNPDQVLKQLEQKGKAAIYGIYFDHDKSDIKPESAESLKVIADVLNKNNSLNLYVVGHTDDKGSPEYNLGLSSKRAKAVVKALVSQYGIKESRLIGYGVGPYAPAANNKNDLGRQLNRRVELVERLGN